MEYTRRTKQLVEALYANLELGHGVITPINHEFHGLETAVTPIKITVVDCETASSEPGQGIDLKTDSVIELCMANIIIDYNDGRVIAIVNALNQLNQPNFKITDETTALTGITNAMLKGKSIDENLTLNFLRDSSLIIAHNAKFDKSMLVRLFDDFKGYNWACSCSGDITWSNFGMSTKSLKYLLFEAGYFYDAHRATPDVFALIQLLQVNQQACYEIITSATKESYDVRALNSPYSAKDVLKNHGFNPCYIDGVFHYWYKENLDEDSAIFYAKLLNEIYGATPESCIFKKEIADKFL